MIKKIIFPLLMAIVLVSCHHKTNKTSQPIDEETGLFLNDVGDTCVYARYAPVWTNHRGMGNDEKAKMLDYYGFDDSKPYKIWMKSLETGNVSIVVVDQYTCILYIDTLDRIEFSIILGIKAWWE